MVATLLILLAPAPLPQPADRAVTAADLAAVHAITWARVDWPVWFHPSGAYWLGDCRGSDESPTWWVGTWHLTPGGVNIWESEWTENPPGTVWQVQSPVKREFRLEKRGRVIIGTGWFGDRVVLKR